MCYFLLRLKYKYNICFLFCRIYEENLQCHHHERKNLQKFQRLRSLQMLLKIMDGIFFESKTRYSENYSLFVGRRTCFMFKDIEKRSFCSKSCGSSFFAMQEGSCKVFVIPTAKTSVTSFVLKTSSIIGSLDDLVGMKITGLPKAQKLWPNLRRQDKIFVLLF